MSQPNNSCLDRWLARALLIGSNVTITVMLEFLDEVAIMQFTSTLFSAAPLFIEDK
jgi:hypothetical protein